MNRDHMRKIGSLGAASRMKKYGNPGTLAGRRKGGLHSLETHRARKSGFKLLKKIRIPRNSAQLAELIGIFMGDGHVHTYQASVCTNSETDREHVLYIKELIENLFRISASLKNSRTANACTIVISSKEVCKFLITQGMPQGSKILLGLVVPEWIRKNQTYSRAFVRGLIDTDGCVYKDKHTVNGKEYSSTCIAFTSTSPELRMYVLEALKRESWSPTSSGRDIRLRRKKDVLEYARHIGFSNPKHARKITV